MKTSIATALYLGVLTAVVLAIVGALYALELTLRGTWR